MKTILLILISFLIVGCCSTDNIKVNDNMRYEYIKNSCLKDHYLIEKGNLEEITDLYVKNTLLYKDCKDIIRKNDD